MRFSRWFVVYSLAVLVCLLVSPELTAARRFALVVGVKEYPASDKLPNLSYTEQDAHALSETLKASGYVVTLMSKTVGTQDGNARFLPTAAFIRKQFADLVDTPFLQKEDCVVVILEGHGIQLPSKTNPEKTTFYFCPSDCFIDNLKFAEDVTDRHNLIAVQELYDTLLKSKAGVKLLITDACRNDPGKPDVFRAGSATRPPVPVPTGGMAAFFSCSTGERAVEDPNLQHGVFSYYLNEGLSGKADSNKNGEITISELQAYVGFKTFTFVRTKYSRKQTPELTGKVQGFAALALVPKPTTGSPVTPPPMSVIPRANQFAGSKAGDLWDKNGLAMKFRWCPPGTFTMGSPENEPDRGDDEAQVEVTLTKGFWLGQYEVTQGEWEKLMGTNVDDQRKKAGYDGESMYGKGVVHPMYRVSWDEAMEFCQKLTAQERVAGRLPVDWEYTLPTEAQWEYACRAGTTTPTAFGNTLSSTQANFNGFFPYNGAAKGPAKGETVSVGNYKPNAWSLYDMYGNVWEWCRDYYAEKLPGGTDPEMLERSTDRVYRGGSWNHLGQFCRSAQRVRNPPSLRYNVLGFRVALVSVSTAKPSADNSSQVIKEPNASLQGQKAGDLWDNNGLGMKFRWCPPGTFTMGSPESEPEREQGEDHVRVTLTKGFWLGQYEVTQGEWGKLMSRNPSNFTGKPNPSSEPVYRMTWHQAVEFCQKLTEQERAAGRLPAGWEFTLPTEAQWEYACRAGTSTATAFGDSLSSTQANFSGDFPYNGAPKGLSKGTSVTVGSYKPNAWSLYDMHGNLSEWCRDVYSNLPGGTDPEVMQRGTRLSSTFCVVRGGDWASDGRDCRSARREAQAAGKTTTGIGFRVALVQTSR